MCVCVCVCLAGKKRFGFISVLISNFECNRFPCRFQRKKNIHQSVGASFERLLLIGILKLSEQDQVIDEEEIEAAKFRTST